MTVPLFLDAKGPAAERARRRALIRSHPELRRLIEWTADYYCAPLAAVADLHLPLRAGSEEVALLVALSVKNTVPLATQQPSFAPKMAPPLA